jgi:hypothetical protein
MLKKLKGLILFSGGLDSILASKILSEQGLELLGLTFKSLFFDEKIAEKSARQIGLPLRIIDISPEHLKMVKKPRFGYGSAMNPCLDCHLMMLKKAKSMMKKEKYDLVVTGEVLGERPMSQNKAALELLERESGLGGFLLRPLSAKLLKKTFWEEKGLIDRNKLLAIQGRQRKAQLELVKKYKIKDYPTPAGGCLLCDLAFGRKLWELFERKPNCSLNDVELLKIGRHFWFADVKVIIGRNYGENLKLKKLSQKGDLIIELKSTLGPTAFVRGKRISKEVIKQVKRLIIRYSKKAMANEEFKIVKN